VSEEVTEGQLERGEGAPAHDHGEVAVTDEAMAEHLTSQHRVEVPEGLSFGALRGMHDRFHADAHAADT
jgi:hypothetical protein